MTALEAASLGVGEREDEGAGFELVSPPLSGREGARSAVEALAVLRRMGIQAGRSSGMHVHVNVASKKVPGSQLTVRQIANLWVAFARFQLVIDEMLSPGRPGNQYAKGLLLLRGGRDGPSKTEDSCPGGIPCEDAKRFFLQMHSNPCIRSPRFPCEVEFFCNTVLRTPGSPKPCNERYPQQRYYALNLVPLARLGTVEFRAHSATYDAERVLHWVSFAVAFVEHFGAGAPEAADPFLDVPAEEGLEALAQAQRTATAEELFSSLEGKLDPGARAFYEARAWEEGAPGCGAGARPAPSEPAPANPLLPYLRSLGEQVSVSGETADDE